MRILYFTRSDSPHDQRFMSTLAQSGHDAFALRLQNGQFPTPRGVTALSWQGIDEPLKLTQVNRLTKQLAQLLDKLNPDLVHAGPIQDVAYLVSRTGYQPLLTMSWGFDLMKDARLHLLCQRLTQETLQHSAGLIVDAQCSADVARSFGFPAEKICKFPWGVDLSYFSPQNSIVRGKTWRAEQGWQNNHVLLCLRSWEPNYGVDVLARAFAKAARADPALRLILLGDGSQSVKIRALLRDPQISERIYFGGRVPNADLPTYYGAADVYISPSHVDGSSVSLMEAMACGLPSIVSDIPANLEWIRQGENGWVFHDGAVNELAGLMQNVFTQDLHAQGLQARQDAIQKADWSINSQVLLGCYEHTFASVKGGQL